MKKLLVSLIIMVAALCVSGQTAWHNPQNEGLNPLEGQYWQNETRENFYQRFPDRAKSRVNKSVWWLSTNCAGVSINFRTNSPTITVRYQTTAPAVAMPHMPLTGSSGLDLYAKDAHGENLWIAGRYSFADTCTYKFGTITYSNTSPTKGYEYQLFLPTYNGVKWMEIGTEEGKFFEFIAPRKELRIVAYGTSITQGACASRPGMIWSSILSRKMDRPLLNYGFSGSGKLDSAVIDLLSEIETKIYIIDCMPNLQGMESGKLTNLIVTQIRRLQEKRPNTPIILADHLGYPHSEAIRSFRTQELNTINSQKKAYDILIEGGAKNIYHLDNKTIAMPNDATVEAIHPTDWGMKVYADAYEKILREVLSEPIGDIITTIPVRQRREPDTYEWTDRHQKIITENKSYNYKGAFIGNSIFHHWGGVENFKHQRGTDSWNSNFAEYHNHGCGYDRIENLLWRIYHDEFLNTNYKEIILKIGTNNISVNNSDEQIVEGIAFSVAALKARQPDAQIKVLGILPRRGMEERIKTLNSKIESKIKTIDQCKYQDIGCVLLTNDGKINEKMFVDGLHPNSEGYKLIALQLKKLSD